MSDSQVRVTFEPTGRAVMVLKGTRVVEAAGKAGLTLDAPCGGQGVCGKCRVQITRGAAAPTQVESQRLSPQELAEGWRLACQAKIDTTSFIHVPESSLFANQHQILAERQKQAAEVLPSMRKIYVELSEPTLADNESDLARLERKLGLFKVELNLLRELPRRLRECGFKGTAVMADHHMIGFEAGDTTSQCYGMAFDIGTTTIVGSLLNLRTGDEAAIASTVNPQTRFGDDVLSRIKHGASPAGQADLQKSVLGAVSKLIHQACKEANVSPQNVYEITFAGNTTMQHLLCGIPADPLGQVPFVSAHDRGLLLAAADLELPIHPNGYAYVFPVIGGFVGGDTVAGIVSTRLAQSDAPVLLVDIGTNGEIVLCADGKLWAASTAAGPAFEGARISCGMRAASGAIEKVLLDDALHISTIGNAKPVGLCGSGLIDLAAELLRKGIVTPEGRLLGPDELPPATPPELRKRVCETVGQTEFVLLDDAQRRLSLTQRDIRELQLATGAIRAGIRIVLKQAGLAATDLHKVLLAGGFGSFIRRSNAQRIGLLPAEVNHERITYVGNTSLDGARWALLSTQARAQAEKLARETRHVELSQDTNFQTEFAEAMIFPEN